MKKFLTVLLALSVVFTYSFSAVGSVFAATGTPATKAQEENLLAAEKTALTEAEANLNKALTELSGVAQSGYVIEAAAWEQVKGEIWTAVKKMIEDATDAQLKDYTATTGGGADLTGDDLVKAVYYNAANCKIGVSDLKTLASGEGTGQFGVKAALAQFNSDYAAELAKFNKVDMSLYSTTVVEPTSDKTYAELAKKYIQDAKDEIAQYVDGEKANMTTISAIAARLGAVKIRTTEGVSSDARFPYLVMTKVGTTDIDSGLYALNSDATSYKALKIKTNKELEDAGLINNADAATLKAQIQQNYADYMTDSTVAKKDTELAKAYVAGLTWLADERTITTQNANLQPIKNITAADAKNLKQAVKDVEALNVFAEKYLAETDADGSQVRAKEAVDKIVKQATTDFYATAAGVANYTPKYTSLAQAAAAIAEALKANDAYKLDFAKKARKAELEADRANDLNNYYPLEQKAVNAAYDAAIAKVDEAKTVTAANAVTVDLTKIKTASDVDALFGNITATSDSAALYAPAHAQYEKAKAYLDYKNKNLNIRDAAYIDGSGLADAIVDFYGEEGARTKAEVEALEAKVVALVDTLPTIGGLAKAKADAEAAINAIPATVTDADKAAVEAAWNAAEAYADMMNASNYSDLVVDIANKAKLDKAIDDLHSAMALDLAKKATAVDKTDKAALKAVQSEIDAYNALHAAGEIFNGMNKYTDTSVQDALDAIQAKELKAVQAAIFAIPVNVTEADKATIEKARALYDAYVDEYTSYNPRYDAVDAIGYEYLRALTVAEATLGLNDNTEKDIKGTHMKIFSSAKKGYIKISWKKSNSNVALDGVEVYRSTKKTSGFKKISTFKKQTSKKYTKNMKKGTKYYFYVKGYKMVDDKKVYTHKSITVARTFRK